MLYIFDGKCDGGGGDDDSQKYSSDLDTPSVCRNVTHAHKYIHVPNNFTIELTSIVLDILTVIVKKYKTKCEK